MYLPQILMDVETQKKGVAMLFLILSCSFLLNYSVGFNYSFNGLFSFLAIRPFRDHWHRSVR